MKKPATLKAAGFNLDLECYKPFVQISFALSRVPATLLFSSAGLLIATSFAASSFLIVRSMLRILLE
jgi:hypothetical protein